MVEQEKRKKFERKWRLALLIEKICKLRLLSRKTLTIIFSFLFISFNVFYVCLTGEHHSVYVTFSFHYISIRLLHSHSMYVD